MNIAHRTHVLPRTYLKRFKSSPGKIWRFDERRSDWREVSLKKQAGVVPDFYPDHVETWLATNIEQPAADGLQKLASAEPPQVEIAKEARLSLSYYLAVQLYRTPAALEDSELVQGARRYIFSSKPEAWVRKVRAKRTT